MSCDAFSPNFKQMCSKIVLIQGGFGFQVFAGINVAGFFSTGIQVVILDRTILGLLTMGLTLGRPAAFGDFRKKTPKHTWLCAGVSPLLYELQTWLNHQKTWQVF